jgi:hypothetical protein
MSKTAGWTCIIGRSETAYYNEGVLVTEDNIPADIKAAVHKKALQCTVQREIQAGKGAKIPKGAAGLSPGDVARSYSCTKGKEGNVYRRAGSPARVQPTTIPKEVRDLITCQIAAQAYHEPESIGKTRSQTQYTCKGGLLSKATTVSEDQVAAENKRGRKCSPKKA